MADLGLLQGPTAQAAITTALVLVASAVASVLARLVLTSSLRRVATRRLGGRRTRWRWRTRMTRPTETDFVVSEFRRQHRVDAAALALSRLTTVVIWASAAVVILHVHGISISVALSGAGFIGLIVALGAQTSVNDYVNGIHVLLEDRFGEGDDIEVITANGRHIRGIVTAHGMFGTRLQADGVTHHLANRFMCEVTNHSQLGVVTTLHVDAVVTPESLDAATAQIAQARPHMAAVVVDSIDPQADDRGLAAGTRVHLRAAQPLGETDQHHLAEQLHAMLTDQDDDNRHR